MGHRNDMTAEERELAERLSRSTWRTPNAEQQQYVRGAIRTSHTEDAITMPANHPAIRGWSAIEEWYMTRRQGHEMNTQIDVDTVDVVGDLAVVVATFRVTRNPEEGVAAVDHAGRWLAVFKRDGNAWKMWRDMDTNSPDGDHWYTELKRDAR
jgi:ketosteroid isomerase-like protein